MILKKYGGENMLKTVTISGKDYVLKSSAFTVFKYKNETGRGLLEDLNDLNKKYTDILKNENETKFINEIEDLAFKLLKLAHIMIVENDKTFMPFEDWIKEIDDLVSNPLWIQEVIEMGMTPFSGRNNHSYPTNQ